MPSFFQVAAMTSCQFHPTISDTRPASPTAVLLHLYYLHDPRLGLPRSHHSLPADLSLPPPFQDDTDSELDDDYDDEELWCAGPGLYVAFECVRVWIEADTTVRELCEHLEDIVSWPIDDAGVQLWHGDSKLLPTHTFQQLAWFRQLLPATTASPTSSPYNRVLLCLPADPCVCAHCCRIDFARAKRRVKLVRRHIELHYTEMVRADDEEEELQSRARTGRNGNGSSKRGKTGNGLDDEEDDSWMDEVETSGKSGKEKAGGGGGGGKGGQKGKGAGSKSGKKKQAKEAQRLQKKEKEAKEERDRKVREQRERDEAARQERAKREAEATAEQERIEKERDELRRFNEQRERHREATELWQKEWVDERKVAQPTTRAEVVAAPAAAVAAKHQQRSKPYVDKPQSPSIKATLPTKHRQQQHQQQQHQQPTSKAVTVSSPSLTSKQTRPHQPPPAVHGEQQHDTAPLPTQHHPASQQHDSPQQQQQNIQPHCMKAAGNIMHQPVSPVPTSKPVAVSPPRWKGWGHSPHASRVCPPHFSQPLSPYPHSSTASTDDDTSSLNSDCFSLFSSTSALLPPSSPTSSGSSSMRSHRLSSASSSHSASTVTSPCLSSLSGQSLSPSLPPLFCDKSADMPLPTVLSPFTAARVAPAAVSSRASALWPLSQPQHAREVEVQRHWQDDGADEDAVLQAACSEYSYYKDEQQCQQAEEQQWTEHGGWQSGVLPLSSWALGSAAPGGPAFAQYDGSLYTPHPHPGVHHAGLGGRRQLYGYMPLVQYVPVYISNEQQLQSGEG